MSIARHFLITGTAGFVGFHLARRLLADGHGVTGIDAMTPYYDVGLKEKRLALLEHHHRFRQIRAQVEKPEEWRHAVDAKSVDTIVHLAAQAGVRYSIDAPETYVASNLEGGFAVLDFAREARPDHLLIASTSSVYGMSDNAMFAETDETRHPISFYAATKVGMEAMAHAYAHIHAIPTTVFRFFTVYGPWGRPDMALFKFTRAILAGEPIEVYGDGRMERDFTYIDDLIEPVVALIDAVPETGRPVSDNDSLSPVAPYRVVNLGDGKPVQLMDFIATLEDVIGIPAKRIMQPMQPGDVTRTSASPALMRDLIGQRPKTSLEEGIKAFVDWYRTNYN